MKHQVRFYTLVVVSIILDILCGVKSVNLKTTRLKANSTSLKPITLSHEYEFKMLQPNLDLYLVKDSELRTSDKDNLSKDSVLILHFYITHLLKNTFFDKAFILTLIFSLSNDVTIVFTSTLSSMSFMAFFHTHLNIYIQKYLFADFVIIITYFFFGIKYLVNGIRNSNTDTAITKTLNTLNKRIKYNSNPDKLYEEESRILCRGNNQTFFEDSNFDYELDQPKNAGFDYKKLIEFFKIFTLIFITEMGYKTQITTVDISALLTGNSANNTLVLTAIVIVHFLNIILSCIIGSALKFFLSALKYELTIISGSMLIALAVNMLYLTVFHELLLSKFHKIFLT